MSFLQFEPMIKANHQNNVKGIFLFSVNVKDYNPILTYQIHKCKIAF